MWGRSLEGNWAVSEYVKLKRRCREQGKRSGNEEQGITQGLCKGGERCWGTVRAETCGREGGRKRFRESRADGLPSRCKCSWHQLIFTQVKWYWLLDDIPYVTLSVWHVCARIRMQTHNMRYIMTSVYISDWCHTGQLANARQKDTWWSGVERVKCKKKKDYNETSKRVYIFEPSVNSKVYSKWNHPLTLSFLYMNIRSSLNVCNEATHENEQLALQ